MRMYHKENSVNRHEDDIYHVGKELRAWCYYWYVATSGSCKRSHDITQDFNAPRLQMYWWWVVISARSRLQFQVSPIHELISNELMPDTCQNEIGSIERAQELSCEWQKLFEWVLKLAWCYLDTRRINAALLVLLPICVVQQSMQVAMDD